MGFFSLPRTRGAAFTTCLLVCFFGWRVYSAAQRSPMHRHEPQRVQAWQKVSARLRVGEDRDAAICAKHAQRISDFFAQKRSNARAFAEDVTGWDGKWQFVKSKMASDKGKAYQAFLRDAFQRRFFSDRDLQELLKSTITSYLSELEGQENALLVEIRSDLSVQALPELRALSAMQTDAAFRSEYAKLIEKVVPTVGRDLQVMLGREAVVWIGSDMATAIAVRVGSAAATRLGISGGILGSGAVSGVATLGVGLAVSVVVDAAVDWFLRQSGYDPAGDIARQAAGSLSRVEDLLVNGDKATHPVYERLRKMQAQDRVWFVRDECGRSADRIDASGVMGLRHELNRLYQVRCRLREAALKNLVLEGGRS